MTAPQSTDWPYGTDQGALPTLPLAAGCRFSGLRRDGTCGRHAVITATGGCVHEHVHTDVPVCQYHVEEVAAGDSYCYACSVHDGHDCPLMFDPRTVRDLETARPEVFGEVAHA